MLYSRVAFELKTKGALIAYLDALSLASKLDGLRVPVVTDTINLAQMQREYHLPLADFVDAVKRVDEEDEMGMSGRSDRVFNDDDDYDFDEDE